LKDRLTTDPFPPTKELHKVVLAADPAQARDLARARVAG
jgi:hypothetical protein